MQQGNLSLVKGRGYTGRIVIAGDADALGGGFLSNYVKSPAKRYDKTKMRTTFGWLSRAESRASAWNICRITGMSAACGNDVASSPSSSARTS